MKMLRDNGELSLPNNEFAIRVNPLAILIIMTASSLISIGCYYYQSATPLYIICAFLLIIFLLIKSPKFGLYATLLILPISWTIALDFPLLGIAGLKVPVVLPFISFLYLVLVDKSRRIDIRDGLFIFFGGVFFTIAIIRCYPYLAEHATVQGKPLSILKHILSNYLRQMLLFLLIVFIPAYVKTKKDICLCIKVILWSIVLGFATVLLIMATAKSLTFDGLRDQMELITGIHPGYFANYFLIALPVTLLLAILKKWRVCYLIFGMELFSIAVTFSRASYVTGILSILAVLVFARKIKYIFVIMVSSPILYMLIPDIVTQRIMTGVAEKNIDVLAAGRIEAIWEPLLQELSHKPMFLLFGNGRYGLLDTTVHRSGAALDVNNAHNIILDAICDGGILLAVFFISFFFYFLLKFLRVAKQIQDPMGKSILMGTFIGVIAFIMKGMTDGVFWAESSNALVYVMIGLSLAVTYFERDRILRVVKERKCE